MDECDELKDDYCVIKTVKKNDFYSLLEMKEKSSDEIKYVKIYNKDNIISCNLENFIELIEKEKELILKNILIYDKYIITEKYFILIMKKYESNVEEMLKKKELNELEINKIMLKLITTIKVLEEKVIIHLSPEMLKNEEMNIRNDLWDISVLFYRIFSKIYPFNTDFIEDLKEFILQSTYGGNRLKYNRILSKLLLVDKENLLSIDEIITSMKDVILEIKINNIIGMLKKKENDKWNNMIKEMKEKNSIEENYKMYKIIGDYYFFEIKEYKESIPYYQISLEYTSSEKEKYDSNILLGCCYFNLKQYKKSLPYFETTLETSFTNEQKERNSRNLGVSYFNLKDYKKAISYFKISLLYCTTNEDKRLNYERIGQIYLNMRHYETALSYYKIALEYSFSNEDKAKNYISIGCCYYYVKDYEKSLELFHASLDYSETDESKYTATVNLADCYLMLGNVEKYLCEDNIKLGYYRNMGRYYFEKVYREVTN